LKFEQGEFEFIEGPDWVRSHRCIPERSGVYVMLVRAGDQLLDAAGYSALGGEPTWCSPDGEYFHLYSGCSFDLRGRIKTHFVGHRQSSPFRKSVLALDAAYGAIAATGLPMPLARNRDQGLTLWLVNHGLVGFRRCSDFIDAEQQLLTRTPSPLNVQRRNRTDFTNQLADIRREYNVR
jgi:hypothetical protein